MLRGHIALEIAEHLNGAVIDTTARLENGRYTLHFWSYQSPEGERTVVIQQLGRAFLRWKVFEGTLEDAQRHYATRLHPRPPVLAPALPIAA